MMLILQEVLLRLYHTAFCVWKLKRASFLLGRCT